MQVECSGGHCCRVTATAVRCRTGHRHAGSGHDHVNANAEKRRAGCVGDGFLKWLPVDRPMLAAQDREALPGRPEGRTMRQTSVIAMPWFASSPRSVQEHTRRRAG